MTLSSLSSTRSPSLATQEASLPAPSHAGTAAADTLRTPDGMPVPRRAGQPGPAASRPPRAAPPNAGTMAAVPTPHPGRHEVPPADQALPMTLARAVAIAKQSDYDRPLAYASDNYANLLQRTMEAYDAAQLSRSTWLASGTKEHQALAQTLAIKAALLNGLYMMRRCHKEWNINPPVISVKTLENVLPLFRHTLALCKKQPQGVDVSIKGLHQALEYLEKQVGLSQQCLEAGHVAGPPQALPASAAYHRAACRELGQIVQQLKALPIHDPASRQTGPGEERSFKSALMANPPAHEALATGLRQPSTLPGPNISGAGPGLGKSAIQAGSARPTPRHAPAKPKVRYEPRRVTQGLETLHLAEPSAPGIKAKPRHPGATESNGARPRRQPTGQPALPQTARREPSPIPATAPTVAAARPVDPAAEAAAAASARLRQEQLDELRAVLAPLRSEARRLHDTAQASASAPTPAGRPWAGHSLEFTTWQSAAQAYDACSEKLATHANEGSPIQHDPAVRDLRCEFDTASRHALERATQAAESALAVFLQAWDAALVQDGRKRAGGSACANLATLGQELQQQWLQAPLRPQMPVLGARMAVFEACEVISHVKAGGPATPGEAADLLCRATAEAQHASEGAKGVLGAHLRTFRASCKGLRDDLLHKAVRHEFEAVNATHAQFGESLRPPLDRSREITTACDALLLGDPLPVAVPAEPALQASPARTPAAIPQADQGLIEAALDLAATVRAQREQAIKLPDDAPEQTVLEQQAVQRVLRQSELSAESAAATITSFHELHGALAQTPLDEQSSLVQRHAKAMGARAVDLDQILLAQEDALEQISNADVRDLVISSCVPLRQDLRHVQIVHIGFDALAQLLDTRVSAVHAYGRVVPGSRAKPGRDVDGTTHRGIAIAMKKSMGSLQDVLEEEQDTLKAEVWQAEKNRLDEATDGVRRRIECDSALIQGRYFLQTLAVATPTRDVVADRAKQSGELSKALAQVNADMEKHAPPSTHEAGYRAQLDMNKGVHQQLRAAQLKLLTMLKDLPASPPSDTSSGSSQAPKPSRRNKHR